MPKVTWTDFNNGDEALRIRNKLNLFGQNVASFSSDVVDNLNVKTLQFINQTVNVIDWVDDATYVNFPFVATITCNGVTENDTPFVMFGATEQESGNYSGSNSVANGVQIWCAVKPTDAIVIPNIIVLQSVNLN